ncbi:hypothetical protein CHS0354_040070 [Potamilus streckersoni]|uniref:Uncharacterized protein n=1 Tax=Potamilus streckersoni TaxID=2493646 RepID=A0AAE0STW5_9BIVA|nr:hypothetical protein CHS0354_040070 [Potamilus streckersoni]
MAVNENRLTPTCCRNLLVCWSRFHSLATFLNYEERVRIDSYVLKGFESQIIIPIDE